MSGKALIESVARNVERLVTENRRLKSEMERMEIARGKLREENRRLAALAAELQRRLAVKELAAGFSGQPFDRNGTKIARTRVGHLMREIDKCIALLNKE
jgi:hypothetical protein